MKVFISWSGRRSHEVAEALGPWLKKVIQSVDYFLSSEMERGVKWLEVLSTSLDTHSFGIICVTPGNANAPWINFEAGALSKHLGDEGRVIPYLLDFPALSDLKPPLSQFNACLTDEHGTWQLVKTLNAHAEYRQEEVALRETFDVWWPKLGSKIERIRASSSQPPGRRSADEKIDELLLLVRGLQRDLGGEGPAATRHKMIYRWVRELADPELFDALDLANVVMDVERDADDAPFDYSDADLKKSTGKHMRDWTRRLRRRLEDELQDERIRQAYDDAGRPGENEYLGEAAEEGRAAENDQP